MATRWKEREADAAALFGARRRILSGNMGGRPDREGSDSTHPRLWIEVKKLARTALRTLWDRTHREEMRRRTFQSGPKPVVLVIYDRAKRGGIIAVHEDDFAEVAIEWLAARSDEALNGIEAAVRVRRSGLEVVNGEG